MKKYVSIAIMVIIVIIVILSLMIVVLSKKDENNGTINRENNGTINYEIISDTNAIEGTKSKKNRGYELVEKDNEFYLIIYHGEVPSYYNSLEVLDVEIKGENVKVTVKLPENGGQGDAFSYPKAVIKFDKEPKKIDVVRK